MLLFCPNLDESRLPCTLRGRLVVGRGTADDYAQLAGFHYRYGSPGPWAAVYAVRDRGARASACVGVIVYAMPVPNLAARHLAAPGVFDGQRSLCERLRAVNRSIRCIRRVIIEPRYRGLGIGAELVRRTLPLMKVPMIESLSVMGGVHSFFETAGMTRGRMPIARQARRLSGALEAACISRDESLDPDVVHARLSELGAEGREGIERAIRGFLKSHKSRRDMPHSAERTRYVLSRLGVRPAYFFWLNPQMPLGNSSSGQ